MFSYARGCAPCIPGAEPARHWFALPLWKTQWGACPGVAGSAGVSGTRRGLACFVACLLCHCGARRGACLLCRLPALPLWCPWGGVPALSPAYTAFSFVFLPLSPRPPSRREGGDFLFSYARGCAPCIPGAEPGRHWFALPLWKTQWGGVPRRCRLGGRQRYPAGGLACFVACLHCHCGVRGGACLLCRLLTLP